MPMIRIRQKTYERLNELSELNGFAMTVIVEMALKRLPDDLGLSDGLGAAPTSSPSVSSGKENLTMTEWKKLKISQGHVGFPRRNGISPTEEAMKTFYATYGYDDEVGTSVEACFNGYREVQAKVDKEKAAYDLARKNGVSEAEAMMLIEKARVVEAGGEHPDEIFFKDVTREQHEERAFAIAGNSDDIEVDVKAYFKEQMRRCPGNSYVKEALEDIEVLVLEYFQGGAIAEIDEDAEYAT